MVESGELRMTFKEFAQKKVLGVPVLYLGAAGVIILAIVAWRMKPSPDTDTPGVDPENALDGVDVEGGVAVSPGNPYAGYNTNGTVVVAPQTPETEENTPELDNEGWAKAGAEWLVAKNKATGTVAYATLSKYLSGEDMSYEERSLVDAVIAEKGQPPEPVGKVGAISPQPARKQFVGSNGTHTVMGPNDNTAAKLATLYYGVGDALHYLRIVQYNTNLGTAQTTYPVGTKVKIPSYVNPYYYTVNGKARRGSTRNDQWFSTIAAIHGASAAMIQGINPGLSEPIKVGTKVRIR
jgi:hypothetical protein